MDIESMKLAIKHLPPNARRRAERALGLPVTPTAEHRVFVYGTLLSGECNARWAKNAKRQSAWTSGTIYDTGHGFPAFTRAGATRIVGELLTVDDEGFASMDRLEGHPRLYRREQITVHLGGGGSARAWVYIMNNLPDGARVIKCGDWRNRTR